MLTHLQNFLRSDVLVVGFVVIGMAVNSLLHLYRFYKLGWSRVTGLGGQSQSITFSFILCFWVIFPLVLAKPMIEIMGQSLVATLLIAPVLLVLNEICGRSILKLFFDVLLVSILYVWLLIDYGYADYVQNPPSETARPFIISELMSIFEISLAILTFVVATFGFSFAPSYIEKYYNKKLSQPTVWWFGFMTLFLSVGAVIFITLQSWILAIQLRSGY